jgi:hypothetical protein
LVANGGEMTGTVSNACGGEFIPDQHTQCSVTTLVLNTVWCCPHNLSGS